MDKIFLFIFIIILTSCDSSEEKYFKMLKGEWQTVKFYHKEKNLSNTIYIINFYDQNNFWIRNTESQNDDFVSLKYKIFKESNLLKMDVKCSDNTLSGNYIVSIDTVGQDEESYHVKLTLDTENNYIQAIRHKLKHTFPPGTLSKKKN
ncbi:hypothetical protein [Flavobacterium celericrescens]|uniref:Lipocalin-like domain-containing protein n=1 Tax=Flavobacterium celericrescens TaxID=2709780 RepID=A0ABX0ID79_9FLAO|nr:hypothetical protein [Flavobacterium celericrescens]NHM03642.1 hypothetical protein [Flavobacterium celericrescens]